MIYDIYAKSGISWAIQYGIETTETTHVNSLIFSDLNEFIKCLKEILEKEPRTDLSYLSHCSINWISDNYEYIILRVR